MKYQQELYADKNRDKFISALRGSKVGKVGKSRSHQVHTKGQGLELLRKRRTEKVRVTGEGREGGRGGGRVGRKPHTCLLVWPGCQEFTDEGDSQIKPKAFLLILYLPYSLKQKLCLRHLCVCSRG